MDPKDMKDTIHDVVAAFLDPPGEGEDDKFDIQFVTLGTTAAYVVNPKDRANAARIIGYKGERIQSIERLLKELGDAWHWTYSIRIEQPF